MQYCSKSQLIVNVFDMYPLSIIQKTDFQMCANSYKDFGDECLIKENKKVCQRIVWQK